MKNGTTQWQNQTHWQPLAIAKTSLQQHHTITEKSLIFFYNKPLNAVDITTEKQNSRTDTKQQLNEVEATTDFLSSNSFTYAEIIAAYCSQIDIYQT